MGGKVLIVNLEFPPIGGPGVQRVAKFARYLPEEGWRPAVICGDKSAWHNWRDNSLLNEVLPNTDVFRLSFRTIADYSALVSTIGSHVLFPLWLLLTREKIKEELRQVIFTWFFYMHPEPMLSWVYIASKKAIQRHQEDDFDVVVTSGPPHITHIVGFILKRFHQVKWVADFRDPWVDSRLQADRVGISRRMDYLWEGLVLRNADCIVSVSPSWTKLLAGKLSNSGGTRVHVIYNGYDPNDLPDGMYRSTVAGRQSSPLHIHYNGTIQGAMSPGLFFKALAELKKKEPDFDRVLKCTFTGLPASAANYAHNLGLNGVVSDVGPLSHEESLKMSANSDVLLLIVNDLDQTTNGLMTGKVYEYLAMGKNILALIPPNGDLHRLLRNYQQCCFVKWDDLPGVVNSLKSLLTKKKDGLLQSVSPPSWIGQYTRQTQTRRLAAILDNLCQTER